MKKILLICLMLLNFTSISFAEDTEEASYSIVRAAEKTPGANCTLIENAGEKDEKTGKMIPVLYECKVAKWAAGVTAMLWEMIEFFYFLSLLCGVMFLVYSGILYSMGGAEPSLKETAKTRIQQTLIGLVVLLCSGYILGLFDWVYK